MIKFRKSFRSYAPGEVAGFSFQHEAWLIEKNIAEKWEAPVDKKAPVDKQTVPQPPQGTQKDPGAPQTRQTVVGPQSR
jgi:hypothetical protein